MFFTSGASFTVFPGKQLKRKALIDRQQAKACIKGAAKSFLVWTIIAALITISTGMRSDNYPLRLVNKFPDSSSHKFDRNEWLTQFQQANVIIHCRGQEIDYPHHWGPLSIKTAFGGREFYSKHPCRYAVTDNNYLVLNEGTRYSSFIERGKPVESLTVNFNQHYQSAVITSLLSADMRLLDDPGYRFNALSGFEEKLFAHDSLVTPYILKIRHLTPDFNSHAIVLNEIMHELLAALVMNDRKLAREIAGVKASRESTRAELFRRLHRAKDYMDSCYQEEITLETLASITWMSPFHLLRQFKKNFHQTPHQYLTRVRLESARRYITETDMTITTICFKTGFADPGSFSKLFKRQFGQSPIQYRLNGC
jgi:AraC-like DNA-binding protein